MEGEVARGVVAEASAAATVRQCTVGVEATAARLRSCLVVATGAATEVARVATTRTKRRL